VIVLDASAAVALLLNTPPHAAALRQRLAPPTITLHAPHLLDLEVAQVLRRFALQGALSEERASAALRDLAALGVERYPHAPFLPRIWRLRHNLTAYDAAYVALAEALDAPLISLDARLQSASGHQAHVELY
jgi:predicted nucleic acid-binding protein